MLRDEPLEYIKEQFEEKNMVFGQFADCVSPYTFYEDIFGDLELIVPITVLSDDGGKKIQPMTIGDAIAFSACRNDTLMGGVTFLNNWISKKSTRDVYALVIDLDNAYSGIFLKILQDDWKNANGKEYPKPTYIANSGTGLHLYFVFDEPIPGYHKQLHEIDKVYRLLAKDQAVRPYVEEQIQWYGQQFRMVGGMSKNGWEISAYRYGPKWNIDELAKWYGLNFHFIRHDEPRSAAVTPLPRKKWKRRKGFKTNRAFYDYSLESCRAKTKEGHRYMSMCALAAIAWKCGVSQDELRAGLVSLLPVYNRGAARRIHESEIDSAVKMYHPKAMETPRAILEGWIGWEYKPTKRNGRSRALHLKIARSTRDILHENWREGNGRKGKGKIVTEYMKAHPELTNKSAIARATGLSRVTVAKYFAEVKSAE